MFITSCLFNQVFKIQTSLFKNKNEHCFANLKNSNINIKTQTFQNFKNTNKFNFQKHKHFTQTQSSLFKRNKHLTQTQNSTHNSKAQKLNTKLKQKHKT